jgi:tape measure domain-containing protein
MAENSNDFTLDLGLDTSKAEKAINKIERRLKKLGKYGMGMGAGGNSPVGPKSTGGSKEEQQVRKLATLETKRYNTLTNIGVIQRKIESSLPKTTAEYQAQIAKVNQLKSAVEKATSPHHFAELRRGMVRARESTSQLTKKFKEQGLVAKGLSSSINNLARSYVSVFAVIEAGRSFFNMSKKLDSVNASMLAASGSAEQAAIDFQYVRDMSDELGRNALASAKGFQQIGTSMRAAGFEANEIKEVFSAAMEASTAFGLSVEDTDGVMRAFSQIASKGSVQAEELRGQLGDRLYGAFVNAAEAMGVTTDELGKMLKKGEVGSKDFLPKFAKQLKIAARAGGALEEGMKTLGAEQSRFQNSFLDIAILFKKLGGNTVVTDLFNALSQIIQGLLPPLILVVGTIGAIVKAFLTLVGILDPVLEKLGFTGGGLGLITTLLATLWLGKFAAAQLSVVTGLMGIGAKAGFATTMVTGLRSAFLAARVAMLSFLAAAGPLGWALAAVGVAGSAAIGLSSSGGANKATQQSNNASTTSNKTTVINNIQAPITVKASNSQEAAQAVGGYLSSQAQFIPSS